MAIRPCPALATLLLATGCTLAPRFTRPPLPVPETWSSGGARSDGPVAAELAWRDYFTEPALREVIAQALDHNRDLRVSGLNVEKMQALYRIQRSELWPDAGVMVNGQKYRLPERMTKDGKVSYVEQYSVNVGVLSWELDFFGRLRSLKAKALGQYLATEQAHIAARTSLVAAVAQSWLALAADRENLKLAQSTLEAQAAFHAMVAKSRELGVASDLDLKQAQSQMDAARADVARFGGLVAQDRNALDLLVGTRVAEAQLPEALDAAGELKDLTSGLPSEVLLGRPDILMAEHQLRGANANIGAARAAFFPRLTLTAGAGSMSPDLSGLFESGTRTWSFTPQLVSPLFAGGSLLANLRVARADRDIAVAQYEKAIQSAFREVSDGLIRRQALTDQLAAQQSLVEALDTAHRLSKARYQEGLDGYLGVLVAQRALYAAQQGLVATRLAHRVNQINLYKALGGRL